MSIFFENDESRKDQSDKVFASVARELSARDRIIEELVLSALDSLAAACPSRQFEHPSDLQAEIVVRYSFIL